MLKRSLLWLLLVAVLPLTGCFMITDQRHNRKHWEYMKRDIALIHEDLDILFALDEPTLLHRSGR